MGLFDFLKNLFNPPPLTPRNPTSAPASPSRNPPPASTPSPVRVVAGDEAAKERIRQIEAAALEKLAAARRPENKKLNLDAAQFAPISSSDALAAAEASKTIRSNPWWGRLDTIPPATDERTLLIDRSLVAYGLIKPEELVEIHKIGDQMLEFTEVRAIAATRARDVVTASDAEKVRLKAQKKIEAAERKRKHAEDVAHRRATDIIFLGRGVSRGLADRRANVEKLQAAGLPVLAAPADVAQALGLTISKLRWLAYQADASEVIHYTRFTVPKKSGGLRELSAPHRELAKAQRWIFQNILQALPAHPAAHGFVRGRSIRTNALPHVGRHTLVNADLKDFFPTITFHRVRGAFEQLGYSPAAATILALLCTESPRRTVEYAGTKFHVAIGPRALPQGACISPALSNLIARRLDSRLSGISAKLGWHYTRYADDLSFSAEADADPAKKIGYLLARVRHIAQDEGFAVNEKKTRVLKRSSAMTVTGIVVNRVAGVRRRDRRRLRAILHNAKKTGLAAQDRSGQGNFAAQIAGQVAFVQMVNQDQARPLRNALDSLK